MKVEDALMRVQAWLFAEHGVLVPIQELEWVAADVNWDDTLDPAVVNLTTADQPGEIAELTDLGATEYGALVRDARRYRWLRDKACKRSCTEVGPYIVIGSVKRQGGFSVPFAEDADAAIDAAMEAAK